MTQKYNYLDFTYKLDSKGNHIVKTNPEKSEPEAIYKYYGISINSILALENLQLYATHPFSFNDSVDSSELLLDFRNVSKERFISFYKRMLIPEEFSKYDFNETYENDRKANFDNFKNFVYTNFTRNIGLISLTTIPFNILMWSHYTNETGFVIEFDTKKLLDDIKSQNNDINNYCFRPIQYVDNLEFIDAFSADFNTPDIPFLYATTIKRKEWEYENEWRLSIYKDDMDIPFSVLYPGSKDYKGKNNRFFKYSKDTLESISLGKHFFNGKNCESLDNDDGIVFKLQKRMDEKYKAMDEIFIKLVNLLYEKYNDILYMSGEIEEGNKLLRSLGKIELEKIDDRTFKLIDLKRVIKKN
ncbi:hypothetical protein CMT69_07880 [Elizabethkingia anophelis]|uniref:DUF2971 domain-containing protein n=1 Tax=Elizabethkingia anophelis TaxID=1117645 RepID=UPI000DD5ED95|nr:DUF2971 domain-containing protein [Elizabethkingia anophelis]MCT3641370.1 DUF2971 domain-containing protein [Elizabethkingia anophelis]MDV3944845.1 hypothetical protein [Elizabethkingia anophelis]RBA44002.1 hypothetical protein DSC46_14600 [Elizabethkingia anophelis]